MTTEREDGDYLVTLKVSNAHIKRKIKECGYKSVYQFCRQNGLSPTAINELCNFKRTPLDRHGNWRLPVLRIAAALFCEPMDLFSDEQRTMVLKTNTGTRTITFADITEFLIHNEVERLTTPSPEDSMVDIQTIREVSILINHLNELQKEVIGRRFGLNGRQEQTLKEVGADLGLSIDEVRTLEASALRILRHPERTAGLDLLLCHD